MKRLSIGSRHEHFRDCYAALSCSPRRDGNNCVISIGDIVISVVLVALIALTLVPAVARMQRTPKEAKCQSNIRAWAECMALYCSDNNGRYPVNQLWQSSTASYDVPLTPDGTLDQEGNPVRFKYGLNWVEALYPYLQSRCVKAGRDWKSFRACPNSQSAQYPINAPTCYMTYAFNANLERYSAALVRNPDKVMMLRELDRLMFAELRPTNVSNDTSSNRSISPFLDTNDEGINPIPYRPSNPNIHGNGSYIAFADGHVHYFTTDYFPDQGQILSPRSWDSDTKQWWNYNSGNTYVPAEMRRTIAITP